MASLKKDVFSSIKESFKLIVNNFGSFLQEIVCLCIWAFLAIIIFVPLQSIILKKYNISFIFIPAALIFAMVTLDFTAWALATSGRKKHIFAWIPSGKKLGFLFVLFAAFIFLTTLLRGWLLLTQDAFGNLSGSDSLIGLLLLFLILLIFSRFVFMPTAFEKTDVIEKAITSSFYATRSIRFFWIICMWFCVVFAAFLGGLGIHKLFANMAPTAGVVGEFIINAGVNLWFLTFLAVLYKKWQRQAS